MENFKLSHYGVNVYWVSRPARFATKRFGYSEVQATMETSQAATTGSDSMTRQLKLQTVMRLEVLRILAFLFLSFWVSQSVGTTLVKIEPWYQQSIGQDGQSNLMELCSEPHKEISDQCQIAVDSFFAKVPLEFSDTTWISIPNRLTYGRAFEDPVGDRKRVFEVLDREECRLENGEKIRWDLKKSCHADAFANFSVFLWACNQQRDLEKLAASLVDLSDTEQPTENLQRQERRLKIQTVRFLETRWLNERCTKHDWSDLRIDTRPDSAEYKSLRTIAKHLGETWAQSTSVPETFILKALAARFGDESAALLYNPWSRHTEAVSWDKHIHKVWSWSSNQLFGPSTLQQVFHEEPGTEERVQMGISMAVSLQKSGLDFEWNTLVRKVCTLKQPDEATCQSAIDELKRTLAWDNHDELQALDKIESISMELGLYD